MGVFSEDINKSCKDALSNLFHWCYDLIKFGLVALSLECFTLLDKLVIVRVEIPVALFTEVLGLTHESLNDDREELFPSFLASFKSFPELT